MSNGEKREAIVPPIKCLEEEKERLELAAEADRLPLATWLRNLGLKRADELGVEVGKKKRASR